MTKLVHQQPPKCYSLPTLTWNAGFLKNTSAYRCAHRESEYGSLERNRDLLVFDDEGHGLAELKNKLVAYPAIVTFLARQLS